MFALQLTAVALAGLAVHEGTHYVACRLAGASARPTVSWGRYLPNPAINTDLQAHSVLTYRLATLAPLVVFVPSVAIGVSQGAFIEHAGSDASLLWVMWCLATMPSPSDWEQAAYAGDLRDYHRAWNGPHPTHAAAEGIAV